jgi:hypothetical protein
MKRTIAIITVFWTVSAFATALGSLAPAPTDPTNAYWQIVNDGGNNVLACVMEGDTVYGNGDDCRIRNTDAFNFSPCDVITLEFDVKVTVDAPEDHCLLQIRDADDSEWTLLEDFNADTAGYEHRLYDLVYGEWGDWTTKDDVFVRFRWLSDGAGTADGIRIDEFLLSYGTYGTFGADNIFTWTSSHGIEHRTVDSSPWLTVGEGFYFEFNYGTGSDTWQWYWAIDDVWVYDSNGDLLPTENFDSWMPDGWWKDDHSKPGTWEQDTDHDPDSSSGPPNAQCDSDGNPDDTYNASLFTPLMPCNVDDVILEFDSNFQVFQTDKAVLNILHASAIYDYFTDDFEGDLSLWTINDVGGNLNIRPSSFGMIKGMYR